MGTDSAVRRKAGIALIELVVAIVIIAILAAIVYGVWGHKKGDKDEKSIPAKAMDKASGVECQEYVKDVRMSIMMEMQAGEGPPAAIPSDMAPYAKCPVSGEPYIYDPNAATDPNTYGVRCPTHPEY